MSEPYSAVVMDHFYSPRSAFVMPDAHLVGQAGRPRGGPFMTLYLRLEGEGPDARIAAASFQTFGCAPAIAAGSLLAERLPGTPLGEAAARWTEAEINEALGGLPDHKRHCSALAAEALQAALAEHEREERAWSY